MIEFGQGNLLHAQVDALVNTVNTVGVMGKGVALQFKQAFPANYEAYKRACEHGEVRLGQMFVWDSARHGPRRYIINFPTKRHWRARSRLEDIDTGLADLVRVIDELRITSIAIPALGCGNGGLGWDHVQPRIEQALGPLPVRAIVFPPAGAPPAAEMPIGTEKPPMTVGRAGLIATVARYARGAMVRRFELIRPGASLLEIQKLMYLLQEAGLPLRLAFDKGRYGPYAEGLNPILQGMEGHYLRGYGDRTAAVLRLDPIEVLPEAETQAVACLRSRPAAVTAVDRVISVADGWEDAYGMELLATVLYASRHHPEAAADPTRAADYVHQWNARKQATFPVAHVTKAWQRLRDQGWIT
jgi:O-acetyl-ADP-ribose deacetylase (regulator of RNase III)